jgi:hypothetical protein
VVSSEQGLAGSLPGMRYFNKLVIVYEPPFLGFKLGIKISALIETLKE